MVAPVVEWSPHARRVDLSLPGGMMQGPMRQKKSHVRGWLRDMVDAESFESGNLLRGFEAPLSFAVWDCVAHFDSRPTMAAGQISICQYSKNSARRQGMAHHPSNFAMKSGPCLMVCRNDTLETAAWAPNCNFLYHLLPAMSAEWSITSGFEWGRTHPGVRRGRGRHTPRDSGRVMEQARETFFELF